MTLNKKKVKQTLLAMNWKRNQLVIKWTEEVILKLKQPPKLWMVSASVIIF